MNDEKPGTMVGLKRGVRAPRALWLALFVIGLCTLTLTLQARPARTGKPDGGKAPVVVIESPASGWTAVKVITVAGHIDNAGDLSEARFILNGDERFIPIKDGRFSQQVVLGAGANYVKIEATTRGGLTGSSGIKLVTNNSQMDLKVILTWDTDRTDVDLWVTDPSSERVYYGNRHSKLGGTLDVDITTGYGPETFTLPRAVPGEYLVQAQYYGGARPTMARVVVVLYEGSEREKRYVFPALLNKGGEGTTIGRFTVE